MKCLRKYQWVKLPRDIPDMGKGLMAYWAMLAFRAAFRKGNASYCGHSNPVAPGMWAGGVVGLKSILGVRSRTKALQILGELSSLGFLKYSLDSQTKKLTYEITDWVVKCSGAECMSGTVYASTGYGFLCLPRNITQRLANAKRVFDEADAWLDLWCHTTYEDYGNAFSFLAPVVQYGRFGSVLTLETLGERWGWEKTKVWRFFKKHGDVFSLYRLPSSYGCLVFNASYPTGADIQLPEQEIVMRILRKILICSAYKCKHFPVDVLRTGLSEVRPAIRQLSGLHRLECGADRVQHGHGTDDGCQSHLRGRQQCSQRGQCLRPGRKCRCYRNRCCRKWLCLRFRFQIQPQLLCP